MVEQEIWNYLINKINNPYAVAGIMGNLYAESTLNSLKLESSFQKKLEYTNESYTLAVDNKTYNNFIYDKAGYGIAQWTYWSRKQKLLEYAIACNTSIGNLKMQLDFLCQELQSLDLIKQLLLVSSIQEASNIILIQYEKPSNQSDSVQIKRAEYGEKYYKQFILNKEGEKMAIDYNKYINSTGTHYISNSGSDENKAYHGGVAGDQTGKEWELKAWYNRPWSVVLRYPDQKVALTIAELSIAAALNNKIGYDQYQRTSYWEQLKKVGYDPSKITVACEEDCTAGVSSNVRAAGYLCNIKALQNIPICSSRNMRSEFEKAGFKALTASKYLTGPKYLLPGDILLYENHHAAANITLGAAVRNEWHPNTDPIVIEPENQPEIQKPYILVVNGDAHIRSGPGTTYPSLGIVKQNTKLTYFGYHYSNGWALIYYENQTAWISGKYSEVIN